MRRRPDYALWILAGLIFISITAEFWANSKPLVMSYKGEVYFPVLQNLHPSDLEEDGFVVDYKNLHWQEQDWAWWPVIRWDPYESNVDVDIYPAPPSSENWLGTDDRGRDVFTRLLYGFRYSLGFAFLVWFFSFLIGVPLGALMGYWGGGIDLWGQRVVEVFESVPYFLLLMTVVSIFGGSLSLLVIFSVLFSWMMISLYMRAEFLKLRKREFVESARSLGIGSGRILFREILPNSLTPILTFSPFLIASQIYALSALDYLGLGLPPPTPSWGELLQQAQSYFTVAWWLALFPSAALIFVMTLLHVVGEGFRARWTRG